MKPRVFWCDMSRCHIFEATTWFAGVDPVGLFVPKKKSVLAACFAGYEPNQRSTVMASHGRAQSLPPLEGPNPFWSEGGGRVAPEEVKTPRSSSST